MMTAVKITFHDPEAIWTQQKLCWKRSFCLFILIAINTPSLTGYWLYKAILCFCYGLGVHFCWAQSSHQIFEHLTTEDGLSSNKVESILQDRDGFYWIATQNGLNRFDGSSFRIFRNNKADTSSLTNNHCTAIAEDHEGDIWVATYKGVCRYQKSTGRFERILLTHPSLNTEVVNRIYNLAVDGDGNIWMAGHGIWRYNIHSDQVDLFRHDPQDATSLSRNILITRILYDDILHGLWISTGHEINFYSIKKEQFFHHRNNPLDWKILNVADGAEIAFDEQHRLWFREKASQTLYRYDVKGNEIFPTSKKVDTGIKQIATDSLGRLWIFYWLKGAEIYDPSTNTSNTAFFSIQHERSVLTEKGNFLYIDQYENYWIGSEKGISIFKKANQFYKIHKVAFPQRGDELAFINTLAQFDSSSLWLGTSLGLFEYNLLSGILHHVELPSKATINSLAVEGNILWISSDHMLTGMDLHTKVIVKNINVPLRFFFLASGAHNDLWLGGWNDGLARFNQKNGELHHFLTDKNDPNSLKSNHLISGFSENGLFWAGYNAGIGFSRFSIATDQWTHYHPKEMNIEGDNIGTITVITRDREINYWLGTHGGGLLRFNLGSGTFQNFQQEDGLNSNYINSIIPDTENNLWISTADGISFFNSSTHKIRNLDVGLVFPNNDFKANGVQGVNGKLYFFSVEQIIEIDPGAFRPTGSYPAVVISSFKIFDQEVPLPDQHKTIHLSHKENFFSFHYSSIRTQPLKDVQYAYMLKGFDRDWNHAGTLQQASYTNVPAGDYVFQVKTTNEDGLWSEALLNIPVRIKPPYWQTWWFISLCVVSVAAAAYGFHLYRISQVKKIYSVRTQISRDLHDDIGASLSSINIYSSVAESEVKENPDKAREIIQQINTNSRQVMENISDIVWANRINRTEDDTLASRIKNYGYELLSHKGIDGTYEIDPHIEKKLSGPDARKNILLIIKEAINNIAKYSEATEASIKVQMAGSYLNIMIEDNGKGFDIHQVQKGNGLIHMKQRAEALGGELILDGGRGSGTSIKARIPLANISDR
jgi:ligand-binding sensor domain-containing protein